MAFTQDKRDISKLGVFLKRLQIYLLIPYEFFSEDTNFKKEFAPKVTIFPLFCYYIKEKINNLYIQYLNRLSDYLFVLARAILKDNNAQEIEWQKD